MKNRKMFVLALTATMLFATACGGKDKAETTAAGETAADTQTAETTAAKPAEAEETSAGAQAAATTAAGEQETAKTDDAVSFQEHLDAIRLKKPASLGTITLGELSGLTVKVPQPEAYYEGMEDEFIRTNILPSFTQEVEDKAVEGDTLNINYVGTKDGVAFDGGTAEGYDLTLGSGTFIDGFESGLIGTKKGDVLDLNLRFPDNYGAAELAGQDVVFTVTVNAVKRPQELTDAFVEKTYTEIKTVEELRTKIRESLKADIENYNRTQLVNGAMNALKEGSGVALSDEAVEWAKDLLIKDYYELLFSQSSSYNFADILTMYYSSYQEFRDYLDESARELAEQSLIADAVLKKEKIQLSEADVRAYCEANGGTYEEKLKNYGPDYLRCKAEADKAADVVLKNAKIEYGVQ